VSAFLWERDTNVSTWVERIIMMTTAPDISLVVK
jgi:hypothetical protein